jgi:hypothetical protein
MSKFRKKPVVIEAVQFTGENKKEIVLFTGDLLGVESDDCDLMIITLEGSLRASPGDWIIKGIAGEFYPCKPDIFAATYEPAE